MRRLATWAAFWVVLFPLWLLYEGEWDRTEVVAGAAAATIGATAATIAVEVALLRHRLESRLLVRVAKVPWAVVREFGVIAWFLVRNPRGGGQFQRYEFPARSDPVGRARRTFTALVATYSPNSYVVDVDGELVAHTLKPVPRDQVTLE
jgi:multisubunit Na+/H+ antiporter MnhE subunit